LETYCKDTKILEITIFRCHSILQQWMTDSSLTNDVVPKMRSNFVGICFIHQKTREYAVILWTYAWFIKNKKVSCNFVKICFWLSKNKKLGCNYVKIFLVHLSQNKYKGIIMWTYVWIIHGKKKFIKGVLERINYFYWNCIEPIGFVKNNIYILLRDSQS
jgi:hypothetical protein